LSGPADVLGRLDWEAVSERLLRKIVHGDRMTCTRYRFSPGGRFPLHAHDQEQMAYVIRGRLTFALPDGDRVLERDQLIVIAPGIPHSALAGDDGAEVLSVVSPPRTGGRGIDMIDDNERRD
jgi:quercetin dioxygenase-like cupin family protein